MALISPVISPLAVSAAPVAKQIIVILRFLFQETVIGQVGAAALIGSFLAWRLIEASRHWRKKD